MKKTLIHIKVDEDLKKELENEALKNGISLNGYIRMILLARDK
jgi:predicted HicB family RNase H-like nuclease